MTEQEPILEAENARLVDKIDRLEQTITEVATTNEILRDAVSSLLGMTERPFIPVPGCLLCEPDGTCTGQCAHSRKSKARAALGEQS